MVMDHARAGGGAWKQFRLWVLALLVFVFGYFLAAIKPPLSEVHWDAPIMLYASKRVLESDFHANFLTNATEVARQVERADWDRTLSYFPEPFWVFTKLGHVSLIAAFVGLGETPEAGLRIAHVGFGVLLVASVAMALLLARNLALLFGFQAARGALEAGLGVTALLLLLSGSFWHLVGNFVSEVPALFFMCASLWTLSKALRDDSVALAGLSGLALFAAYLCRPDAVWFAICLAVVLISASRMGFVPRTALKPLMIGATVAALSFMAYVWLYHPLADPRLYLAFAELLRSYAPDPVGHFFRLFVIAGGLLWFGVLLALLLRPWQRSVALGLFWLVLVTVPWVLQGVLGSAAQSRMFVMAWPPLILLSALGWARLFEGMPRVRRQVLAALLVAVAGLSALVTVPVSYTVLQDLPGGWQLQYLRRWLVPDRVEGRTYPVALLLAMRNVIHDSGRPALVIVDPRMNSRGNLDILRFLGPPHRPLGADLTFVPWPHARWENPVSPGGEGEPVVYRAGIKAVERRAWQTGELSLLLLSGDSDRAWAHGVADGARVGRVVEGEGLWLTELLPAHAP